MQDPELWFPTGDCFVHLYSQGASRREPSFRVHVRDLIDSGWKTLILKYATNTGLKGDEGRETLVSADGQTALDDEEEEDGGFRSIPNTEGKIELYIPPPPLGKDDAQNYQLATRNFLAVLYEKPVVGPHLGEALVRVRERMSEVRLKEAQNDADMMTYIEEQGYTDFRYCPDHAIAVMHYAEKYQDTDLWTEAFVHCVGMYDILISSIEFPVGRPWGVKRVTNGSVDNLANNGCLDHTCSLGDDTPARACLHRPGHVDGGQHRLSISRPTRSSPKTS